MPAASPSRDIRLEPFQRTIPLASRGGATVAMRRGVAVGACRSSYVSCDPDLLAELSLHEQAPQ